MNQVKHNPIVYAVFRGFFETEPSTLRTGTQYAIILLFSYTGLEIKIRKLQFSTCIKENIGSDTYSW